MYCDTNFFSRYFLHGELSLMDDNFFLILALKNNFLCFTKFSAKTVHIFHAKKDFFHCTFQPNNLFSWTFFAKLSFAHNFVQPNVVFINSRTYKSKIFFVITIYCLFLVLHLPVLLTDQLSPEGDRQIRWKTTAAYSNWLIYQAKPCRLHALKRT